MDIFFGSHLGWNQYIYKTDDSGNTWSNIFYADSSNVWVLKFFNENIGLMSVNQDELFRTIDGSSTWEKSNIDFGGGWALDIEFHPTDPNLVWMGNDSYHLYSSNDGGVTWTIEQTLLPSKAAIWDIYTSDNSVWCAGSAKNSELFVNRNIAQHNWEMVQIPLEENEGVEGVIDGVGDNIIVLPGYGVNY